MIIRIHPENPEPRKIKQIVDLLNDDAVIIFPTDTVYGLGCKIDSHSAVQRICKIKNIDPEKANLSFICADFSKLSLYTKPFSTSHFKLLKKYLPGPYTFILNANNDVPKLLKNKKKTVGIRIPNSPIVGEIISGLDSPLMSSSIKNLDDSDDIIEYPTDPEDIFAQYGHLVDAVIDGGVSNHHPSTIIDLTDDEPQIIRLGSGIWNE